MTKHTRQGTIERLILELIERDRSRRGRRYGMRRDTTVSVGETQISCYDRRPYPPTRSRRLATRAAMRRFATKHPTFAVEVVDVGWGPREMYLFDVESRDRELADKAETAEWLRGVAARR